MDEIKIALLGFDSYNVARFTNNNTKVIANTSNSNINYKNSNVSDNIGYTIHPL